MEKPMTDLRDPDQFEHAYRRLAGGARAAANSVLKDPSAAEDVAQDVFMHLWQRPQAYDPRRGSLETYVSMVARARAIDRWRSARALERASERAGHEVLARERSGESADERAIRHEQSRDALHALRDVPAEQREAIVLTAHGLAQHEIASVTRVPLGTAKGRIRLGLQKARAALVAA
jgi:RNA polymerase sigma-70 factor (ECF subfamily)